MTTIWTPQTLPVQRWAPKESGEQKFIVLDPNFQLAGQIVVSANNAQLRYDLTTNIVGGRYPYTFTVDSSTFPANTLQLEPAGELLVQFATPPAHDTTYTAIIRVRDANDQEVTFVIYLGAIDNATFQIIGPIPDAHFGVAFDWTPTIIGGILPLTFRFQGLNLEALGFSFDVNTAHIFGRYTGAGSGPNLFTLKGWTGLSGSPNLGAPDALLTGSWNLLNP
jgi:hypothetical protein